MKSELEYVLQELAQYIIYGEENIKQKYKKEEIPKLDPKINDVQKIYKKFQKIEKDNYWRMEQGEIFYKQAKFLENFEDDYKSKPITNSYYSYRIGKTYSKFSFEDFRTYFSWRSKVRKEIFENTEWYYQEIYINELLNKIGCKDAQDAIDKLIEFWKGCRQFTLRFDNIMPNVIKEFYIINTVKEPYAEIVKRYPITTKSFSQDLKDIKKGIYKDKIIFLNETSSYEIIKSKLNETDYGYLLNECAENVFLKIHKILEQEEISLPDMLVYKNGTEHWWHPLREYDIYEWEEQEKEIIIEGTQKYEYKNGVWHKTIYSPNYKYKNTIGCILKTMEYYIREYLGYRKLKLPEFKQEVTKDISEYYYSDREIRILSKITNMNIEKVIYDEILQYLKDKKIPQLVFRKKKEQENDFDKEEKVEVIFNQSQFESLRKKSEEIQKALIIEEIEEIPKTIEKNKEEKIQKEKEVAKNIMEITKETSENPKIQERPNNTQEENVYKVFVNNLTNDEKEIINILLNKQDIRNKMLQVAQKQNQMIEVMVSNINDKALENIGDTIIGTDMQEIYKDYENEIKQVL